ncbi:MAG TPA: hypothetical protein VHD60_00540 [Candidatus Saccharimonadales bacterium]|nr:hypothetical protein [Candidatus Saccharimonadales bacterium]
MTKNIIELNGKRYDAISGQFLGPASPHTVKSRRSSTGTSSLDGVLPSHHSAGSATPVKPHHSTPAQATHTAVQRAKKPVMDIVRPGPHHTQHHHTQHSKTLMRHAVHKPKPSIGRHLKVQTRTDVLVTQPAFSIVPKLSYTNVNERRLAHAKRIAQSELISKFAPQAIAPRPVSVHVSRPAVHTQNAAPRATVSAHPRHDIAPVARPQRKAPDIFEQALIHAKSHEEPPVKPKKHAAKRRHTGRRLSVSAAALAIVLLAGFFAYQNKANLEVRVASLRAGFHVSLPGYQPTGFSFGNVHYSPGKAVVSFHDGSNQSYSVTQKVSTWDSQTLLNDFVATTNQSYQAYQAGGRTVYVYGEGNATWVGNGVWYQLSGASTLSNEQLVLLAAST